MLSSGAIAAKETPSSASPLVRELAGRLAGLIRAGSLVAGEKLATQRLADDFGVSRSPVREALAFLAVEGLIEQRPNRGYFVRSDVTHAEGAQSDELPREARPEYRMLAEDWLHDRIPAEVTEQMLRERYGLTRAQLSDVLVRASREGWAEPKQGYGWRFLPVAKTSEAFTQIYRFRLVVEPAALLEPTFELDHTALGEQRRIQEHMLETGFARLPAERLIENGALFHEELVRMSGNSFMHMSLVRVNRMRRLFEYRAIIDRDRLSSQCTEHLQIIDALEAGDREEAARMLKLHLEKAVAKKAGSALRLDPLG
ncbi:GntR family transcriptional regulator [Agaricicola taiwanensis]|uniref:GntR family transcriptional regulator n=1 Tax=Agaricicola taiwanensis TaxID=591372 RepID=A0A8J2YDA0_9RHOB|nr:GntR family transcriptional regulator [Agaricicola taiwanensis]GGE39403.1 GntR family transcriptional regulator [Agaricicola taiwanensis]